MTNDTPTALADHFVNVFQRLISGEELDLYEEKVSSMFEIVAAQLFIDKPQRKFCWYDGVVGLTARVTKLHQVEFTGQMWVGDNKTQWKESFKVIVSDRPIAKQGISITLWVGTNRAEGEIAAAFGISCNRHYSSWPRSAYPR